MRCIHAANPTSGVNPEKSKGLASFVLQRLRKQLTMTPLNSPTIEQAETYG